MQAPEPTPPSATPTKDQTASREAAAIVPVEIGGPSGPEPTRYGDWEKAGRCMDF
ncbi:MAG: DUF1674 domain-containing protein [Gammaproteobacteria bacterium]|nr:DUF1674 domain-containing protein [Gammaproteobacteria bacterium]